VMVPRSDGMPNTLLEALACGAVPILNRLPQYTELIKHGVNGFLVDPDEGDLAGALIGVLSDPGLKRDIARRNRDLVVKIGDQDQEMSRMESWYFKLAAASSNEGLDD
ncbi:MAG: glycosyltransferase, partial [Nitrospirae bacterium]|nr:glycosyltransferase [Nitrospirota bacterium]